MKIKKINWGRFAVGFVVAAGFVLAAAKAMSADVGAPVKAQISVPKRSVAALPDNAASQPANAEIAASVQPDPTAAGHAKSTSPTDYSAPTWGTYYSRVDAIRADTEMATAELENLKIRHELEQARDGKFQQDGAQNQATPPGLPTYQMATGAPVPPPVAADTRTAVVDQTSMVDNQWVASIRLPSGVYVPNVHVGGDVPGVGKVTKIGLNEVLVDARGRTVVLPFANDNSGGQPSSVPAITSQQLPIAPPMGIH